MQPKNKKYYVHLFFIQNNVFKFTVGLTDDKLSECYMCSGSLSGTSPLQQAFVFTGKKSLKEMEKFVKELAKIINDMKEEGIK